ncbi:hypothetical protein KUTeg_017614 [Tegillarca granosa]|uniref:Uncharacterized protein n=1 Tax=Tegillarca granosa TaxID=220873 RepID=A0ABQ9EJH0_TEGGR|nr:hypothetical protein KUTeg_017614 [Tegillarca granosa]
MSSKDFYLILVENFSDLADCSSIKKWQITFDINTDDFRKALVLPFKLTLWNRIQIILKFPVKTVDKMKLMETEIKHNGKTIGHKTIKKVNNLLDGVSVDKLRHVDTSLVTYFLWAKGIVDRARVEEIQVTIKSPTPEPLNEQSQEVMFNVSTICQPQRKQPQMSEAEDERLLFAITGNLTLLQNLFLEAYWLLYLQTDIQKCIYRAN